MTDQVNFFVANCIGPMDRSVPDQTGIHTKKTIRIQYHFYIFHFLCFLSKHFFRFYCLFVFRKTIILNFCVFVTDQ